MLTTLSWEGPRKFISQERHIRILIRAIKKNSSNDCYVHHRNINYFCENRNYELSRKITKIDIYVLQLYLDDERCWQKAKKVVNSVLIR